MSIQTNRRHYHREYVESPHLKADVDRAESIEDLDLRCPVCDEPMRWSDASPEEKYMPDGEFESEELYICDECNVRAYVTQVYAPVRRKVCVERTIWDD